MSANDSIRNERLTVLDEWNESHVMRELAPDIISLVPDGLVYLNSERHASIKDGNGAADLLPDAEILPAIAVNLRKTEADFQYDGAKFHFGFVVWSLRELVKVWLEWKVKDRKIAWPYLENYAHHFSSHNRDNGCCVDENEIATFYGMACDAYGFDLLVFFN